MLALRKFINEPWERVRGYLKLDLDDIETRVNQLWSGAFDINGKLRSTAIQATTITTVVNANPPYVAADQVAMCRFMGGAW